MKRLAMMAATLVAAAMTAGAQSGELGGGFSILLDSDHFDGGGGVFVYGAVRPAPFYSLRGTLMAATADTDSDVLWPAEFSTLGLEGSLLLHWEPAPNLRFRAGGGVGAYTYEQRVYETVVQEIDLDTTFVSFGVRGVF